MKQTIFNNIIILTSLITVLSGTEGYWIERSQMPEPLSQHAAVTIGNTIYVTGGRTNGSPSQATRQNLWAYDILDNQWTTTLPAMSAPREDHASVAIGDTLWVFGGRNHDEMVASVDFWVVGSSQWQHAGQMPMPREGLGAVTVNGMIYLIGGKSSHAMWAPPVTRVDQFNPQTGEWSVTDTLNQARVGFAWAAHGDTIMCAGGRFVDPLASVERRLDSEAWQDAVPLSGPRSDGAAVFFHGDFVLLGGIGPEGQADQNQIYSDNGWQSFEQNLLPRYEDAAVVAGDAIYVIGGRNGNQPLRSIEQFVPLTPIVPEPKLPESIALISAFPNPFNGSVRLKISLPVGINGIQNYKIYNMLGQIVAEHSIHLLAGDSQIQIQGDGLGSSGIYWVEIEYVTGTNQSRRLVQKLTYLK